MTKYVRDSASVGTPSCRSTRTKDGSRRLVLLTLLATILMSVGSGMGCGTGAGAPPPPPPPQTPPSAPNELPVVVSAGAGSKAALNRPFVSVTICIPSTSNCQTIDNVLLDTGSTGLRLFSSVLTLPVPNQQEPPFGTVYECSQFQNFYAWGPVATADVQLSGETAQNVGIQIIGDTTFSPPTSCGNGSPVASSPQTTGMNGILGVSGRNDCGSVCFSTPGFYYYWVCSSTNGPVSCQPTLGEALAQEVWNPVALFPTDNNGIVLDLPAIPENGATNVQGSLYFGIGTQGNNQLGSAVQFQLPLTAVYGGEIYGGGIDTGTPFIGYLNDNLFGLPTCGVFYCPSSPTTFTLEMIGANRATFTGEVVAADPTPVMNQGLTADPALVAPGFNGNTVVLGLPFFYGRKVFQSISGPNASTSPAPFVAF